METYVKISSISNPLIYISLNLSHGMDKYRAFKTMLFVHIHMGRLFGVVRPPEFCMDYSDETWYVGSGGQKYYPRSLWSLHARI